MASEAPAEAFKETGESGAVQFWVIPTASTPKKKAVRRTAPRLPGSSYFGVKVRTRAESGSYVRYHPTPQRKDT